MPLFGSHLSIAGGMVNAILEAERLKMDTVQVFTKNQQQWKVKPLDESARNDWLTELKRLAWQGRTVSHASYLINLASPDDELWDKSVDLMTVEVERCAELEIPYLVHHPGAYTTSTPEQGLARIAKAYKTLLKRTSGMDVTLCLEDTVGSGSNMGRTFEELATLRGMIVEQTGAPERVGFCFDTCHAHAGGYDMSSRESADRALDEFDRLCGLANLKVVHLNDSKGAMGSKKDRHEHIGSGTIGSPPGARRALKETGFAAVVNRPELGGAPMILETPKGEDEQGRAYDAQNLRRVRGLLA
ncbi:MAG: deoxyribonuclease IV [Phycisphaerales bacterium]